MDHIFAAIFYSVICQNKTIMKKILLVLVIILPTIIFAQNNEGEITFNQKVKFKIDIPEGQEDLLKMMPTEQNFKKTLLFTPTQSLFFDKKEEEKEDDGVIEAGNDEVQIKIVMTGAEDNKLFKDLEKDALIQKEAFFGKDFLITGNLDKFQWKLTGKQKKILDYNCQEATFTDKDNQTTVVWFTPEIPVPNGPDKFGQLPGMILAVSIDGSNQQFEAAQVTFRKIEKGEITAPKKGKKVTSEKFNKIVEAKMKEMEEEMGGGTGIKIKID